MNSLTLGARRLGMRITLLVGLMLTPLLAQPLSAAPAAFAPHAFYAVTTGNTLIHFSAAAPGTLNHSVAITGLQGGEEILGIDVRPATGQLYGLGSTSRLYQLNPQTGVATIVGSGPFSPTLSGGSFGFDFNPIVDRIRVVSDNGQNLRLHPVTGAVAGTDIALNPGTPQVAAAAYTNNFTGTTSTTLYVIDAASDSLQLQGGLNSAPSPNGGLLSTVGLLGIDTTTALGFDIAAFDGIAFAAFNPVGTTTSQLYTVNLATGAATLIGAIAGTEIVRAFTVAPQPPLATQFFGLTTTNNLVRFNANAPVTILNRVAISGLQTGESIIGIDVRPRTSELYGLSNASRLYRLNPMTGAATQVGATAFSPALNGTVVGFDFNPAVDRIRVVMDSGQNLRLHPDTGAVAGVDTVLSPGAPQVVGAAYTDNFSGTTTTTLYVLNAVSDTLQLQGGLNSAPSPNGGVLTNVGNLGVDFNGEVGFDIATENGIAFAALNPTGTVTSRLYVVDLTTGAATSLGVIGSGEILRGLAVASQVALQSNFYAVTTGNNLVRFNGANPGLVSSPLAISGLQSGETILGLDTRPATGQLYALGSSSRLYRVDPTTGVATQVGSGPFVTPLSGTAFGFDFNPVVDRIRVVSNNGQNLRLHPDTGAVAGVDTTLTPGAPQVVAAAYTDNFSGTTTTTLYVINAVSDTLQLQGGLNGAPSPNGGLLTNVGGLGVDAGSDAGLDIDRETGTAFGALTASSATSSQLYTIDLATGAARLVGKIGGSEAIHDLTVAPPAPLQSGFYAITAGNNLIWFSGANPNLTRGLIAISGLQTGETILGIDLRPATGQLYALGSTSRLYRLSPLTGAATIVGSGPFSPTLSGTAFGFDFNPVVDRIRVVSNTGQNLRLHPVTGVVAGVDTSLAPGGSQAVAAAYTNNFSGTTTTTLFVIDAATDSLQLQGGVNGAPSPNGGLLSPVWPLGVDITGDVGFDIQLDEAGLQAASVDALFAPGEMAFAALTPAGATSSRLYVIDLLNGAAKLVGRIGGTEIVSSLVSDVGFVEQPTGEEETEEPTALINQIFLPLINR